MKRDISAPRRGHLQVVPRRALEAEFVIKLRVPVTTRMSPRGLVIRYPMWSPALRTDEEVLSHMREHPMQACLHSFVAGDVPIAARRLVAALAPKPGASTLAMAALYFWYGCLFGTVAMGIYSASLAGWTS